MQNMGRISLYKNQRIFIFQHFEADFSQVSGAGSLTMTLFASRSHGNRCKHVTLFWM